MLSRPGPECRKYIDHSRRAENGQSLSRALCSSSLDGSPLPPPPPLPTPCRLVQSTAVATRCSTRVHPARHGCECTYMLSSLEGTQILAHGCFPARSTAAAARTRRTAADSGSIRDSSQRRRRAGRRSRRRREEETSLDCSSCQAWCWPALSTRGNTRELAMLSDVPDRSWFAAFRQDGT